MTRRAALTHEERSFISSQRVAHLATADGDARPHVVPVCFALDGEHIVIPLDEKPKRVSPLALRRARNIAANSAVSLVFDRYDDDWSRLGYALVQGIACIEEPGSPAHRTALPLLRERYPQYRGMALEACPLIVISPRQVSSWGALTDVAGKETLSSEFPQGYDFLSLAKGRRSVRAFEDRPVPRAVLEAMIEAAGWAPSPHGRQPWRFALLTRPESKRALADAMGAEWQRTLEMDGESTEIVSLRLQKSHERIETAPAIMLACLYLKDLDTYPDADRQLAEETMATQSLGAAIQNALLCAYSLGLHTGWMCAPLFCPDTVRAALGLDETLIPHALITVGYLAREPKRRPRRSVDELILRVE